MNRIVLLLIICFASVHSWASDKETGESLLRRAGRAAQDGKSDEAVRLATAAIEAGVVDPMAYYLRGREHFRVGKVKESIADFDRFLRQRPDRSSSLWERGISCYYGGEFAAGAKQFADYQTFHSNDVENAVWHVLCNAKVTGFATAQQKLMPIRFDRRVPMMTIYDLYRGKAHADDVLKAARDRPPNDEELNRRLFYAHLYVGLYYEARGEADKAREHILAAAEQHRIKGYMWDVAHVHAQGFKRDTPTKSGS